MLAYQCSAAPARLPAGKASPAAIARSVKRRSSSVAAAVWATRLPPGRPRRPASSRATTCITRPRPGGMDVRESARCQNCWCAGPLHSAYCCTLRVATATCIRSFAVRNHILSLATLRQPNTSYQAPANLLAGPADNHYKAAKHATLTHEHTWKLQASGVLHAAGGQARLRYAG